MSARWAALAAVALLVPAALGAQNGVPVPATPPASPAPGIREVVVVTAERGGTEIDNVPAAVSVLTRAQIERLPVENLGEIVAQLPGFRLLFGAEMGGAPMTEARGFFGGGEAEYVQLRVDGVPVADLESGLGDWRAIPAAEIERVEALRGPASPLYGDTAFGGVVQVFTRRTGARRYSATLGGGGDGYARAAASAAGGLAGDGTAAGGIAASLVAAGFRGDGFRSHSAFDGASLDAGLRWSRAAGEWSLALAGSRRTREEPGPRSGEELARDRFGSDTLFRFDRERADRGRLSLAYERAGAAGSLRGTVYASARESDFTRTLLIAPGYGDRALRNLDSAAAGASVETERLWQLGRGAAQTRAGVELAHEDVRTGYRAVGDDGSSGAAIAAAGGRRQRLGVYALQGWQAAPRLRLTGGLRWDRIADDFGATPVRRQALSPRGGLLVRLGRLDGSPVALFASVSRSFKAATLDQLFDPRPFPDFAGGTFTLSNPSLSPQRALAYEAGARQESAVVAWDAAVYEIRVTDEIDFDPATFTYRNIGSSVHRGLEIAATFAPAATISPWLSYQLQRVTPAAGDNRGRQLKNIPRHVLRAGAGVTFPHDIRSTLTGSWVAGRYADDANRIPLSDDLVFDLRAEKRWRALVLTLDLLNVTDERRIELGYTLPDATGGEVPYYQPGAGITARAALTWTF